MKSEMLINAGPGEVRAALLEDGRLVDLVIERAGTGGGLGEIYLARAVRVLPGLNAAFLDIGGGRDAYLSRADAEYADALRAGPARHDAGDGHRPISELVAEGEALIVQIAREAVGDKAPQATTKITLPGHRLVYTPTQHGKAVSRRIVEEAERDRLAGILAGFDGGFIVRTAGAGAEAGELEEEADRLRDAWGEIRAAADGASAPAALRADGGGIERVLRDQVPDGAGRVVVEGREALTAAQHYAERFAPAWAGRVELYEGDAPIFEDYGVEAEIEAALGPRADLPSGGNLVIEPTQALTAIDVNTGSNVGRGRQDDTILETNLEAAAEAARQIRLRNIAGLVAIDFIRMDADEDKRLVVDALVAATRPDPQPVRVGRMTPFGLVELTRRRGRPPLADLLLDECRRCEGTGRFRAPLGIALGALRAVLRQARANPAEAATLVAGPAVIDCLMGAAGPAREAAEEELGREIPMRRQAGMPGDRFDLVVE